MREKSMTFGLVEELLGETEKAWIIKIKFKKSKLQNKYFYSWKYTIKEIKLQATHWEKRFPMHVFKKTCTFNIEIIFTTQ